MAGEGEQLDPLENWDDPPPARRSVGWVGPLAILAVVVIVVAAVLGGTQRGATDPVTTPSSTSATVSVVPSSRVPSAVPASSTPPAVLPSIAGDDPAEPLRITLLDPTPASPGPGLVAYKVQICAQSGGVASDTVRIAASNWRLATSADLASTQPGVPDVDPRFPVEARLRKGECASGYVTFAWNIVEPPAAIYYADGRFSWLWRLT